MKKEHWKTMEGEIIDVDDMTENHLRNALKYLLRRHREALEKARHHSSVDQFLLMGDMANEFNNTHSADEDDDRFDEQEDYVDYLHFHKQDKKLNK